MPPLRRRSTNVRHAPLQKPLKRVPLQELPIKCNSRLNRQGRCTSIPIYSADQENLSAIAQEADYLASFEALDAPSAAVDQVVRELTGYTEIERRAIIPGTDLIDLDLIDTTGVELDEWTFVQEAALDLITAVTEEQLQQAVDEVAMEINDMVAAQPADHPRLSMPLLDSDDSGSEPDLSVLGMARPGTTTAPQIPSPYNNRGVERVDEEDEEEIDDDEAMSPEQYEAEDTSIEEEEEPADDEDVDEVAHLIDPATAGLKEISNLARFTVSSHKPGNGVEELKSDDLKMYWQ